MTSAHFGWTACSALWLLASVLVDCISLTAVLILDMSIPVQFMGLNLKDFIVI